MSEKMKKRLIITLGAVFGLIIIFSLTKRVTPVSWAIHNEINQDKFSDIALDAYDAVSYFTGVEAIKGSHLISYQWKNATWYFSSEENKASFISSPKKYAPAFGGYCSFAVSKGFTAVVDPTAYTIMDSTLYLFSDQGIKSDWLTDSKTNIKLANKNWEN